MKQFLLEERKITRYIIAAIAIFAMIIGFIVMALSSLRQEAIQTHRHIANLHAYTIEEHFSQILQHSNITIDRIPLLSNESTSNIALSPVFTELLHNAPYLRSLSLLNDEGVIIASSHEANIGKKVPVENFLPIPFGETPLLRIGVPWAGRDFDNAHSSTIEEPIPSSEITFLPLLKKAFFEDRLYYVIANINIDYLTNRYTNTLPTDQGYVSLWRIDGTLLVSTNAQLRLGSSHYNLIHPQGNEDFFTHLRNETHTLLDVFRLAKVFPFIVEIQTNEANTLGYWDKERQKILGIITLLITLTGALTLTLIARYYKENSRQREQLSYENAMEATQTGLWTWNLKTNQVTWDPQCFLLLGYQPNAFETPWDKIYQLTHPDDVKDMLLSIQDQILARSTFLIERRMKTASGEWVWIQVRGKVIEFSEQKDRKSTR